MGSDTTIIEVGMGRHYSIRRERDVLTVVSTGPPLSPEVVVGN